MPRILTIRDLRSACERLLDAAESEFGSEIDLDSVPTPVAEYWSFDPKTAFTLAPEPEREAGSVTDDLAEISEFLQRPKGDVHLWHDLDHLCGLLRLLVFMDYPEATT